MRKVTIGLASILVPALTGLALSACGDENDPLGNVGGGAEALCGPCGVVAQGDVGISGNAKLDGFFQAVNTLNNAVVSIRGDFEANIDSLIATFGVDVAANATLEAKVDALTAKINAEIDANVDGSLVVNYAPPRCQANVNVAVEAQAKCEVKAGCTGEVNPGSVNVKCEGKCEGSCSAGCTGGYKCDVAASGECGGSCEGSCELAAAATCNGTCRGECTGTCSAYAQDNQGNATCAGQCDGQCEGTCELNVAAECNGSCRGKCVVTVEAECEGRPVECSGSCTGECSGSCQGSATPPSAHVDCEASADCQAQAKAQASASVECSPPSLEVGYQFAGGVNAEAQAAFGAKISALKVRGAAIMQGFARYQALISGEVNGETVFNPAPVALVRTELQGVVTAGVSGQLFADIPVFRATCALDGLRESGTILTSLASNANATLSAQADFAAALGLGG